jgi:hypothetical protein
VKEKFRDNLQSCTCHLDITRDEQESRLFIKKINYHRRRTKRSVKIMQCNAMETLLTRILFWDMESYRLVNCYRNVYLSQLNYVICLCFIWITSVMHLDSLIRSIILGQNCIESLLYKVASAIACIILALNPTI